MRLRRKVAASVERLATGFAENAERPTALSHHARHRVHVDLVEIGALLPIDLDAHEELVHQRGGGGIFEGFVLHHVAPVTRAIADGDEQRLVLRRGAIERLASPGIPVDRVVHVLAQVCAGLFGEAIGGRLRLAIGQRSLRCWRLAARVTSETEHFAAVPPSTGGWVGSLRGSRSRVRDQGSWGALPG